MKEKKRFKGIKVYGQKETEVFIKDTIDDCYYYTQDMLVELLNDYEDKLTAYKTIMDKELHSNPELKRRVGTIISDKLEEERDNMSLFLIETILPLLKDCVFELQTIETMSQVELAERIEEEVIPFIREYKYLQYESIEEMKENEP